MIIKFLTRKNIYSAKGLVKYILTDKRRIQNPFEAPIVIQNINRLDLATMHRDFLDNFKYLPKRKGIIALEHVIIAINKKDKGFVTKDMLQDLMNTFIKLRGLENAPLIAKAHDSQHIHIMHSSNNLRSKKRLRMSQKEMKTLVRNFELAHIEKYPQLQHSIIHTNREPQISRDIANEDRNNRREKEFHLKRHLGGKMTKKEKVSELVNELLQDVGNFEELVRKIQENPTLKIYTYRGQIRGILFDNNKKWRFKTLHIQQEKIRQLELVQNRLKKLSLIMEVHRESRGLER